MIFDKKKYLAKKIKEYRIKNRLTQAELAEKIDISTKQVSRIEVGDFYPSLNTFFKIIDVLEIDLKDFTQKIPKENSKIKQKLIEIIYNANEEELKFYDRLLTFANDERAELKKNIRLRNIF